MYTPCVTDSRAHLPCPSCARRNAAASAGLLWHQGLGDVPLAGKRSWKQNIPVRNIKLYVFLRTEAKRFGRTLVWLHIEQLPPDVAAQRDNNHPSLKSIQIRQPTLLAIYNPALSRAPAASTLIASPWLSPRPRRA